MLAASWEIIYDLLVQFGAVRRPAPLRIEGGALSIAWEAEKVALVTPGDYPAPFKALGWSLHTLPKSGSFDEFVTAISDCAFDVMVSASAASAENPSQPEQILMAAFLRAGLPVAKRDLRVHDPVSGQLRSIPDFVWEDRRLVVDLDGWYHHGGRQLDQMLAAAASTRVRKNRLKHVAEDRAAKDASKRRLLTSLGWTVMVVNDTEIEKRGPDAIAAEIRAAYDRLPVASAA